MASVNEQRIFTVLISFFTKNIEYFKNSVSIKIHRDTVIL